MKRIICIVLCVICLLSVSVNAQMDEGSSLAAYEIEHLSYEAVALDEDEEMVLGLIGDDIHVITDEDFISKLSEISAHVHEYEGQVYQLEGLLLVDGEDTFVYRVLASETNSRNLGIAIRGLNKDILSGAWIRITGIVAEAESSADHVAVLDVVAVEAIPEYGMDVMPWDGSAVHTH